MLWRRTMAALATIVTSCGSLEKSAIPPFFRAATPSATKQTRSRPGATKPRTAPRDLIKFSPLSGRSNEGWPLRGRRSRFAPRKHRRDEHWHPLAIAAVVVAVLLDQVAFLKRNADEDVRGRDRRE